jgi:hypothetical protein
MFMSSAGMASMKGLVITLDSSQPLRTPSGWRTKLQPSMKLHAVAAAAAAAAAAISVWRQ